MGLRMSSYRQVLSKSLWEAVQSYNPAILPCAAPAITESDLELLAILCTLHKGFLVRPLIEKKLGKESWSCRLLINPLNICVGQRTIENTVELQVLSISLHPPFTKYRVKALKRETIGILEERYADWVLGHRFRRVMKYKLITESQRRQSVVVYLGEINSNEITRHTKGIVASIRSVKAFQGKTVTMYFHWDLDHKLASVLASVSGFDDSTQRREIVQKRIDEYVLASGDGTFVRFVTHSRKRSGLDQTLAEMNNIGEWWISSNRPEDRNRILWSRFLVNITSDEASLVNRPNHPKNRLLTVAGTLWTSEQTTAATTLKRCIAELKRANASLITEYIAHTNKGIQQFCTNSEPFKTDLMLMCVEIFFWFQKMDKLGRTERAGLEESAHWESKLHETSRFGSEMYESMHVLWNFLDKLWLTNYQLAQLMSQCSESNLVDYLWEQKHTRVETREFDCKQDGFHEIFSISGSSVLNDVDPVPIVSPCMICQHTFLPTLCQIYESGSGDWNHDGLVHCKGDQTERVSNCARSDITQEKLNSYSDASGSGISYTVNFLPS